MFLLLLTAGEFARALLLPEHTLAAQPRPLLPRDPTLTPEQVRARLGPPQLIARQILYSRYLEQWVYDGPPPQRVTFHYVQGEKPRLLFLTPDPR